MEIQEIKDLKIWQEFVEKLNLNTFLHSQSWADFNSFDSKVWQLGLFEDNELLSICLVIKIEARRGNFLLVPHGPQYDLEKQGLAQKYLPQWRDYLKKLGTKESCNFIRIQPIVEQNEENQNLFSEIGFKLAPMHVHTELTSVLNIAGSPEEILLGMRKTTRQMIKKALKMVENGEIQVEFPESISPQMQEVYAQTYKRGGAVAYSGSYLDREWEAFKKYKKAKLVAIYRQEKLLSWGMFLISGKRAFYHQGGNLLDKKIPNSYLCQWLGINFAKENGCISYDFWGVAPQTNPEHPWAKISLFKRGFGGEDVAHLHAQDYILNWKYFINWIIEKYRAKKRGF